MLRYKQNICTNIKINKIQIRNTTHKVKPNKK